MTRAALLVLALAASAHAYDSRCYVDGGAECAPGPQSARSRWIGVSDEHRELWLRTLDLAGLPALPAAQAEDQFDLQVFTTDDPVDVAGTPMPTLAPVAFFDATRKTTRTTSAPEFAQLPDFGFALWDWATGLETCPLDPALPTPAAARPCHDFSTHMGAVNSNHFLPQAQAFFTYYHGLALARAAACRTMRDKLGAEASRFGEFLDACAAEAFVLEAIGHHFLQDAWSSGHMWERWGSPDLIDFTDHPHALLVAMTSGLIHGARGVLQEDARFVGTDVNDALCAPGPRVGFSTAATTAAPALGDLFLDALLAGDGADFPEQFAQLFSCAASSVRQVVRALGETPGAIDPRIAEVADPPGDVCFGQRATNAALSAGIGLDFKDPTGTQQRIELDSAQAAALVPLASAFIGGDLSIANPAVIAQYTFDLSRIVTLARLRAVVDPTGTGLARGGLGPLLGVAPNSAFVQSPLAPYVDPPLPWPDPPTPANDAPARALALARTFHRAHASDWCARFHAGSADFLDVEALRSRVETLRGTPSASAGEINAACAVCSEFAARHLRAGTSEADHDTTREPLCHFLVDPPASPQYVYQQGNAGDDVTRLAKAYCGCGCPFTFAGSVSDNIDQTDFTDETGSTRHGFEHNNYTGLVLTRLPDGTFTATGTFTHASLDEFRFPGDPGETCRTTLTENGSGTVTGYGGNRSNPAGSLEATATVTQTFDFSPCRGRPGSTDTETFEETFRTSSGVVTPTVTDGCLTALTWSFFFFDPSTNTTDSTSGGVTGAP